MGGKRVNLGAVGEGGVIYITDHGRKIFAVDVCDLKFTQDPVSPAEVTIRGTLKGISDARQL